MKSCPECECAWIHQSKRKGIVERTILTLLFVRPFRCENCDARFYLCSVSANWQPPRQATPFSWQRKSLRSEPAHLQK